MAEIVLLDPFFDLPSIGLESKVNEFTLDTERFEREMGKRNGGLDLLKLLLALLALPLQKVPLHTYGQNDI